MNALIIGFGNIGRAIAEGVHKGSSTAKWQLQILVKKDQKVRLPDFWQQKTTEDLAAAVSNANIVLLCVKPQSFVNLGKTLAKQLKSNQLVISTIAGMSLASLGKHLEFSGAIVRAMPNLAATVLTAASVICKNSQCSKKHLELASTVFSSIGSCWETKESLLDAVTGLSGSGPAYICMIIEALTDGGVKMGISRPLSLELATQTVLGAAKLVQDTGLHPAIIKDRVTTPGGTTIHAIHELETHGLRSMLISAVATATSQSKALNQLHLIDASDESLQVDS